MDEHTVNQSQKTIMSNKELVERLQLLVINPYFLLYAEVGFYKILTMIII